VPGPAQLKASFLHPRKGMNVSSPPSGNSNPASPQSQFHSCFAQNTAPKPTTQLSHAQKYGNSHQATSQTRLSQAGSGHLDCGAKSSNSKPPKGCDSAHGQTRHDRPLKWMNNLHSNVYHSQSDYRVKEKSLAGGGGGRMGSGSEESDLSLSIGFGNVG